MMKRLFLAILMVMAVASSGWAADHYALATGNWNAATSWSDTEGGGAGSTAPVAGDNVYFPDHFTGTITVTAAAACATITVTAGSTGTLDMGIFAIVTTGNLTFTSGFTVSQGITANTIEITTAGQVITGGGITNLPPFGVKANCTFNTNGSTIARIYHTAGAHTITLSSALQATIMDLSQNYGATTFAGAYDMTIGSLYMGGAADMSTTFVTGTTVTVNTKLQMGKAYNYVHTVTAAGAGFTLHNNGTSSVHGAKFTNVTATHTIYNWYGEASVNSTGISVITPADIGAAAVTHAAGF